MIILKTQGGRSFVDDLNTKQGIVRSRVTLLLRSSEIKPLFLDLFNLIKVSILTFYFYSLNIIRDSNSIFVLCVLL